MLHNNGNVILSRGLSIIFLILCVIIENSCQQLVFAIASTPIKEPSAPLPPKHDDKKSTKEPSAPLPPKHDDKKSTKEPSLVLPANVDPRDFCLRYPDLCKVAPPSPDEHTH